MRNIMQKIIESLLEYNLLQTRRIHPQGEFDKAGRFYLDIRPNCDIRSPSRGYPYPEMTHGRTLDYVCQINEIEKCEKLKKMKLIFDRVAKTEFKENFSKLYVNANFIVKSIEYVQSEVKGKSFEIFTEQDKLDIIEALEKELKRI